jgi:two-component system response regulator AtoC
MLLRQFLSRAAKNLGQAPPQLSDGAMSMLLSHSWPGNIRELRNVCDYLAATCSDGVVTSSELTALLHQGGPLPSAPLPTRPHASPVAAPILRNLETEIRELEQRRMMEALTASAGIQVRAAELLGMPIRTFSYKLKQYGLAVPNRPSK